MDNARWKIFFELCAEVLGEGTRSIEISVSWCSWTTFSRLGWDAGYWQAGLPEVSDIGEANIKDGGVWGQPFHYSDIAHIIIPKTFMTEQGRIRTQEIQVLAEKLARAGISSRLTDLVLEIKIY